MILEIIRDSWELQAMFYVFVLAGVIKSFVPVIKSWLENRTK